MIGQFTIDTWGRGRMESGRNEGQDSERGALAE